MGSQERFFSWIRKSWMFISYILGHEWFCTDECKHLVHQSIVDFLFFDSIHYCNYTKTWNLFLFGDWQKLPDTLLYKYVVLMQCSHASNILGLCLVKRKLWLEFPILFKSLLKSIYVCFTGACLAQSVECTTVDLRDLSSSPMWVEIS